MGPQQLMHYMDVRIMRVFAKPFAGQFGEIKQCVSVRFTTLPSKHHDMHLHLVFNCLHLNTSACGYMTRYNITVLSNEQRICRKKRIVRGNAGLVQGIHQSN